MGLVESLPRTAQPICLYPEAYQSCPRSRVLFLEDPFEHEFCQIFKDLYPVPSVLIKHFISARRQHLIVRQHHFFGPLN
jgi:hypothetical protein